MRFDVVEYASRIRPVVDALWITGEQVAIRAVGWYYAFLRWFSVGIVGRIAMLRY